MKKSWLTGLTLAASLAVAAPAFADQKATHYNTSLYSGSYAQAVWVSTKIPYNSGMARHYLQAIGGINNLPMAVGFQYGPTIPYNGFYFYYDSGMGYHDVVTTWTQPDLNPQGYDMNYEIRNTSTTGGSAWQFKWNSYSNAKTAGTVNTGYVNASKGYVYTHTTACNSSTTTSTSHQWWGAMFQNTSGSWFYWPTTTSNTTRDSSCGPLPRVSGSIGNNTTGYTAVY